MSQAAKPPADITPQRFFEEWLPSQLASAGHRAERPLTVRVRLDGQGGGHWELRLAQTGLSVGPAGSGDADVTLLQSVEDWRAIALGEPGTVKGTIRFEVTEYNARTWSILVRFGAGDPAAPDATISIDAETYAEILARRMAPPQAYFAGKVKLAGDVNLALQLGMAMMPRFT
jgi:putative sterol carrier protein